MTNLFESILQSNGPRICVIAAPGSGKTRRVLIPKASKVLSDPAVDPKNVLLLTFSRLSAKDLKDKVADLGARKPRASTVHSLCLAFLLSEDNHGIRKRIESILLDFEREVLLADLKLLFPSKDKRKLRKVLGAFSAGWATKPHDEVFEEDEERRSFKAAVLNWLSEHEAAMMEEIVYQAVDLAKKLGNAKFLKDPEYIFVDECQDLNHLEQEFINVLAAESKLLVVVGDPDQSIYSFKYAYPTGINTFAKEANDQVYRSSVTDRCPTKVVAIANQLLKQANPARTELISASRSDLGEVHFVRKETQIEEFEYVAKSIAARLAVAPDPSEIIVLVPRTKLGREFTEYANSKRVEWGVPADVKFEFVLKPTFTELEQERLLRFGLVVKPDSLVHARTYVGLGDSRAYAPELKLLKDRYGNLATSLKSANADDFPSQQKRVRALCERVSTLREWLAADRSEMPIDALLDELFPKDSPDTSGVRAILDELREDGDTPAELYGKFIDYMRTVPTKPTMVRVMTMMASKGLEADHVYILGCNAGNLPGPNRSSHMSEHEHNEEQRRLLFVGVTRAVQSLTISWSRHIPFSQSKGHYTPSVKTVRYNGELCGMVGMSAFLQDLSGVTWET